MAGGFSVDLEALRGAADGVTDTLNAMATKKVKDIDPAGSAFGHGGLADAVGDFCDRWEIGVEHLCKDASEIVDRLTWSMQAYTHVDDTLGRTINGILSEPSGPDPAVP